MLGCTLDAMDSFLYSTFFDPAVPCNAVGVQLMGIRNALGSESQMHDRPISALKKRRPEITALWLDIISTGQARRTVNVAMNPLPPVNLAVGTWTGVVQSFLQVQYDTSIGANQTISRASEFITAYYVQPAINAPLCRTPPFGRTFTKDTSLHVREHLENYHRPQKASFNWRLYNGQPIFAKQRSPLR